MHSSFPSPPSQGETPLGLYKECVVIVNHHSLLAKFLLSPLYVSPCSSGPKKLVSDYLAPKYFQSKLIKRWGEEASHSVLSMYLYEKDVLLPIYGSSLFSLEF